MIRIGFCDDEDREIRTLERYLSEYEKTSDIPITFKGFNHPMRLIDYIEKNGGFDILLLDIYMPGLIGTDVAKEVRLRAERTEIIFMTTSRVHAVDAYALGARQYLTKPYTKENFFEVIGSAINDVFRRNESIVIKTTNGMTKLNVADIIYSYTYKHYQNICLSNGSTVEARMKSEELSELLTENLGFVRNGITYIINLRHIVSINAKDIMLTGDYSVPVSRGLYKELCAKYMAFMFGEK